MIRKKRNKLCALCVKRKAGLLILTRQKPLYDDLEVIYEFYKEGEAPLENLEARYEKAINAIEKIGIQKICFLKKVIA
jgi:hypothetical protein